MIVIALNRYQAITSNFYRKLTNSCQILVVIIVIWIFSGLFSLPEVVFNQLVKVFGYTRCRAVYPSNSNTYRKTIILTTFATQLLIPLLITMYLYIKISIKIW